MTQQFPTARSAKDFLVQKVASQAAVEDIPLTDAERKLMYYSVEDPPNESLPDRDADADFEEKISGLIRRAYEKDSEKGHFKAAFKELAKGDHYLSAMKPFGHFKVDPERTGFTNPIIPGGMYIPGISLFNRGWGRSTPLRESGRLFLAALAVVASMFLLFAYWQPVKESFWQWLRANGK